MTSWFGSTGELDDYERWVKSRPYKVELTALLVAGGDPSTVDYDTARLVVRALSSHGLPR